MHHLIYKIVSTAHQITQVPKKIKKYKELYFFWFGIFTIVAQFWCWDWEICLYSFIGSWGCLYWKNKGRERDRRHDRLGIQGRLGIRARRWQWLISCVLKKLSILGRLGPVVPTVLRLICASSAYVRIYTLFWLF